MDFLLFMCVCNFVMITGLPRISDYQKIDVKLENFQAQEEKPVGTGNLRIAKGQDAKEGEFPYVVALLRNYHKTRNYHEHRGSGTLVTNAHVLTACHLLINEDGTVKIDVNLLAKPSDIGIMAGTVDWNNTAESIRVYGHELKVHPLCARTHTSLVYDFGLVLLERALELKQGRIEALKFPDYSCITLVNSLVYELAECVIMGWGSDATDDGHLILQKIHVALQGYESCRRNIERETSHSKYGSDTFVDLVQVCAEGFQKGQTFCAGDTGGPLMCQSGKVMVGVASYTPGAENCKTTSTHQPMVFARIDVIQDFISEFVHSTCPPPKPHVIVVN